MSIGLLLLQPTYIYKSFLLYYVFSIWVKFCAIKDINFPLIHIKLCANHVIMNINVLPKAFLSVSLGYLTSKTSSRTSSDDIYKLGVSGNFQSPKPLSNSDRYIQTHRSLRFLVGASCFLRVSVMYFPSKENPHPLLQIFL